ncbi:MAG: glycogen/starch synthase, partial [Rectinemataceae bacterium]|nr:glycogen/starch synthase [Rectinemataceae bacterium]
MQAAEALVSASNARVAGQGTLDQAKIGIVGLATVDYRSPNLYPMNGAVGLNAEEVNGATPSPINGSLLVKSSMVSEKAYAGASPVGLVNREAGALRVTLKGLVSEVRPVRIPDPGKVSRNNDITSERIAGLGLSSSLNNTSFSLKEGFFASSPVQNYSDTSKSTEWKTGTSSPITDSAKACLTKVGSYEIPLPFPDVLRQRGIHEPEWLQSYVTASLILRLSEEVGPAIPMLKVLETAPKVFEDYGLKVDQNKVLALVNGLRKRGLVANDIDGDLVLDKEQRISLNVSRETLAVWADDFTYIQNDLKSSLDEGRDAFLKKMDTYAVVVDSWPQYPIEARYPVLRAVALMDVSQQEKVTRLLLNRSQWHRTPLLDSVLLMLDFQKAREGWFESQVPHLIGRSIYFTAAEISTLNGGLGRVMHYGGTAMHRLGADIFYIEPYNQHYRDRNNVVHPLDYSNLPMPVKDIVRIDQSFNAIVAGRDVAFDVYTGVNTFGVRTYMIRDRGGYYANSLYEYGSPESPASKFEFTEFFSKAALELIRHLEVNKK